MINRILERLEEEREIAYADFYEYLMKYELDNDFSEDDDWFYKGLIRAMKIVQEVAKEYGWVYVKDRLPEDKREVLVWHSEMDMHCVAWYNPPTRIWYSNDFEIEDSKHIVAWMELPAPYQNGEQYGKIF